MRFLFSNPKGRCRCREEQGAVIAVTPIAIIASTHPGPRRTGAVLSILPEFLISSSVKSPEMSSDNIISCSQGD